MPKPNIITTNKLLPFNELSPLEFERLCLWLVEQEGYECPQHLGEAGGEQGRDIVAFKNTETGKELWYFQCKRYNRITASILKKEIDKYNELAKADLKTAPAGIIFVTSAAVSAKIRDDVGKYCQLCGYDYDFWARTELDMRVKKHPKIIEEFFSASSISIPTSLHQVPPPPRDFTGRKDELQELISKLKQKGLTISGLQGMGGVGKTTLALRIVEELTELYPDGQIFLDLKGTSKSPMSTADAFTRIIRAFYPTAKLPENKDELRAIYYSVLHGKRALFLLDNAASAEQVEPLIPPSTCALLVTSRQYFTLPGIFMKRLDVLPPDDARELLLNIAPRIEEKADSISKLCGYLPLALRLAAKALAERRDLDPATYIERLSDAQKRLALIEASLTLSYQLLTEKKQRLWRALAVFPDLFTRDAAAAVWKVVPDSANEELGDLLAYSLVEYKPWINRYFLHDLARLFADKCLGENERITIEERHAQHYVTVLQNADGLYRAGEQALIFGQLLYYLERENILAGQKWSATKANKNEEAAKLCVDYANAGATLLSLLHSPHQRVQWLETALAASKSLKHTEAESANLTNLGAAYLELGKLQLAITYQEQALDVARRIKNRRAEYTALNNLGLTYAELGEWQRALEVFDQVRSIIGETGDQRINGTLLLNIGRIHFSLGEKKEAMELFEQVVEIGRQNGDVHLEGTALGNLGSGYLALGNPYEAIKFIEKQRDIAHRITDRRGEASALCGLGAAHANLGEHHRAIEFFKQALLIQEEITDPIRRRNTLVNLGRVYAEMGEIRSSISYFLEVLNLDVSLGIRSNEASDLEQLGELYASCNDNQSATEYFKRAASVFEETGDLYGEAIALSNLGIALNEAGKHSQAISHLTRALEHLKEVGDTKKVLGVVEALGDSYATIGDRHNANEYYEVQLALAREVQDDNAQCKALLNLTEVLDDPGQIARKIELYHELIDITRKIGDRERECYALGHLGVCLWLSGDAPQAIKAYEHALVLDRELGNIRAERYTLFGLSLALEANKERARAIVTAETALRMFEENEATNAELISAIREALAQWHKDK